MPVLPRLILAATLFLAACSPAGAPLAPASPGTLRVASYNVHYIELGKPIGAWSVADWERRKVPLDLAFKAMGADVLAFQEMESFRRGSDGSVNLARDWLLARNPGYAAAASGDWRTFPSTQPILYRRERLTLLDEGWFFFSNTPNVIYSRTFNGSYPAFASWAQFRDRAGKAFRVITMHFEYSSGSNRLKSAALVAERMLPWLEAGETVILTGDQNALAGSKTLALLAKPGMSFLPVAGSTYHLNRGLNLFGAIDHIAVSKGVRAGTPVVLRQRFAGDWPSDHYPVVVDLTLP